MAIPPDWIKLKKTSREDNYDDPPPSDDPLRARLFGLMTGDKAHCLYDYPATTPLSDIVRLFRVGSHGAASYSLDEDETIELVAKNVAAIQQIIPGRAVFADDAGFKIRFEHPVSEQEYLQIEALFPEDQVIEAGLEGYLSEWSGEGHPLAPLLSATTLHLWWD